MNRPTNVHGLPHPPLALVGHGTAWTLLIAELTAGEPDLAAWERMTMPDIAVLDVPSSDAPAAVVRGFGDRD